MNENKVIPDNLIAIRFVWKIHLYKLEERPITVRCLQGCDWSHFQVYRGEFPKVNGQQPNFQE